jgi:hypothetical protein
VVRPIPRPSEPNPVDNRLALAVEATGLGLWEYEIATGALFWSDRTKASSASIPTRP